VFWLPIWQLDKKGKKSTYLMAQARLIRKVLKGEDDET